MGRCCTNTCAGRKAQRSKNCRIPKKTGNKMKKQGRKIDPDPDPCENKLDKITKSVAYTRPLVARSLDNAEWDRLIEAQGELKIYLDEFNILITSTKMPRGVTEFNRVSQKLNNNNRRILINDKINKIFEPSETVLGPLVSPQTIGLVSLNAVRDLQCYMARGPNVSIDPVLVRNVCVSNRINVRNNTFTTFQLGPGSDTKMLLFYGRFSSGINEFLNIFSFGDARQVNITNNPTSPVTEYKSTLQLQRTNTVKETVTTVQTTYKSLSDNTNESWWLMKIQGEGAGRQEVSWAMRLPNKDCSSTELGPGIAWFPIPNLRAGGFVPPSTGNCGDCEGVTFYDFNDTIDTIEEGTMIDDRIVDDTDNICDRCE